MHVPVHDMLDDYGLLHFSALVPEDLGTKFFIVSTNMCFLQRRYLGDGGWHQPARCLDGKDCHQRGRQDLHRGKCLSAP